MKKSDSKITFRSGRNLETRNNVSDSCSEKLIREKSQHQLAAVFLNTFPNEFLFFILFLYFLFTVDPHCLIC